MYNICSSSYGWYDVESGKKSLPITKAEKGILESIENVRLLGQFDTGYQSGKTIFHKTGQKRVAIGHCCLKH